MQTMRIKGALALIAVLGVLCAPAWGQLVNLQTDVTGVLPQANGGTGTTSLPSLTGTPAASNLSYWTGAATQALLSGTGFVYMNGASAPTLLASPLPTANGGTGITGSSASANTTLFGASTSIGSNSDRGIGLGFQGTVAANSADGIAIGNATATGLRAIAIGAGASTTSGTASVAIGYNATAASGGGLAISWGGIDGIKGDGATGRVSFPTSGITTGASGTLGGITMGNATSGTLTITPVSGALGTTTLTAPVAAGTGRLSQVIASGAKALATSAIASAACSSAQTDTATGTATTDAIIVSFNGDPTAVTGYVPLTAGMLTIIPYPTADTVNFKVCNNTASSITPGAITLNWRVVR